MLTRSAPATKAALPLVTMAPRTVASLARRVVQASRLSRKARSITFIDLPG